jgi:tripeptide aminopeptidase
MSEPITTRVNEERLLSTFLDLLKIDSPSGGEDAVMKHLQDKLAGLGLTTERDTVGNLIGRLAGRGEPLILCAHVDHVPPCQGITPVVADGVIRSDGRTILGGDDTSGVAIIMELLTLIAESRPAIEPPALEIIFTVREEVGLAGSKGLEMSRLQARQGIVLDQGGPIGTICVQGGSQNKLTVVVHGRRSHAGVAPEEGVNAIRVAAEAIAAMPLGRIDHETTSNIGVIHGGEATNIVPDRVEMKGEARSLDSSKLERQTQAMVEALQTAASRHGATLDLSVESSYQAYKVPDDAPLVQRLMRSTRALGAEPFLVSTTGGSDSNIFNARGVQAVAFSTGMQDVHTTKEWIALADMVACADILWHLLCS